MRRNVVLAILLAGCGSHHSTSTDSGATCTPGLPGASCPDASPGDAAVDAPLACTTLGGDRGGTLHDPAVAATGESIVWDGARYDVPWSQLESSSPVLFGLYLGFAAPDGTLVAGSVHRVFPAGQYQEAGALALGNGQLGLAYLDEPGDGMTAGVRVHFARLDASGTLIAGSDVQVTDVHAPQLSVALAYSPALAQWAVIWDGQVPAGSPGYVYDHQYLSRIDASGSLVMPDAVQIDGRTSSIDAAIAWANDRWAAVISEYDADSTGHVSLAELDPTSGTVMHRIALADGDRPIGTALATDGTRYGAAWVEIDGADPTMNSAAFRIADVGGSALGAAPLVLGDDRSSGDPAIAFDGSTFRIAEDEESSTSGSMWVTRVSRDGTVLGTPGGVFATTPPYGAFPKIASDGCNDAIEWTATSSGGAPAKIQLEVLAGSAQP